jgi:uncharacterized damage-inducible protein DinB
MAIAEALLPEFDHEMSTTRRLLERVPEEAPDWQPHTKSTPIGRLAMHLATLPSWTRFALAQDEFDVNPPDGATGRPSLAFTSTSAMLDAFDENVRTARELLAEASDEKMRSMWSLKNGGHTVFTMPRASVIRSMMLNHMIHHRGQLSVYLRLNDVPLPPIYGPTADEQPNFGNRANS